MVDYIKSVLKELLPAWLVRKSSRIDVRKGEQPPMADLVGAAPRRRYRGPARAEDKDKRLQASSAPGRPRDR